MRGFITVPIIILILVISGGTLIAYQFSQSKPSDKPKESPPSNQQEVEPTNTPIPSPTPSSTPSKKTISKDITPPTTHIVSPLEGAKVSGKVQIDAAASDNVGVAKVEFYIGSGYLLGLDSTLPYSFSWDTSSLNFGSYHKIYVKAYDAAGNSKTSAFVNVIIDDGKDRTPPTVSITKPTNTSQVNGTVIIEASASDNIGVTKVEFYIGSGVLLGDSSTSPYLYSWETTSLAPGSYHSLYAKAYDADSNSSKSFSVNVTIK